MCYEILLTRVGLQRRTHLRLILMCLNPFVHCTNKNFLIPLLLASFSPPHTQIGRILHRSVLCTHLSQLDALLQSSMQLEWDHSREMFHLFFSNFVVGVGGEAWIVHMLYLCSVEGEPEQNTMKGWEPQGTNPKSSTCTGNCINCTEMKKKKKTTRKKQYTPRRQGQKFVNIQQPLKCKYSTNSTFVG